MALKYGKADLYELNSSRLTVAPFIFINLRLFRLLRKPPDVNPSQQRSKRSHRGKRGGQRNKNCAIPVLVSNNRARSLSTARERILTEVNCIPPSEIPPSLRPWYADPVSSLSSTPPPLTPEFFLSKCRLPNILVCNARSLNNKTDELEVVLKQTSSPIAVITECWDINDETGHIKGYKCFFNTRRDRGINRRGGGVGLYFREDLPCKLLSQPSESCHEVIWVECKPKRLSKRYSCLVVAAVYYPESAKNRKELIQYIQNCTDDLRRKHAAPAFVIAGDFNQTNKAWVSSMLDLKQVVSIPTHVSGSILDLIFTNIPDYYEVPFSLGPLHNSDHNTLLWKAKVGLPAPRKVKITTRPMTKEAIRSFGQWIGTFDFDEICSMTDIDQKVDTFNSLLSCKYHEHFPEKKITVSDTDKPWVTPDLKKLILTRCQLHRSGDIVQANKLRNRIVKLLRAAQKRYVHDKVSPLLQGEPRRWHSEVKRLTGKRTTSEIKIQKDDRTLIKSAEVNAFFTSICTTHPSFTEAEIEALIADVSEDTIVEVSEFAVYKELQKLKSNCASYPGELPVKLLREYSMFLAKPLSSVINQSFKEHKFPSAWKKAYVRVLPKVKDPKSCNQLRPISITPNMAKVTESFIYRELLAQVQPALDPFQYGCLKGSSTTHYLVRLYHLITEWLDKGSSLVDLLLVDYRKAFDLIRHYTAANNLKKMGARKHILLLVVDFLRNRCQCVYALFPSDLNSEWAELTCGAPQGTKLAALLFLAVINYIILEFEDRFKYVDDLSLLLKYLAEKSDVYPQFSSEIRNSFLEACSINDLQLNMNKTKVMRFNPLKRDLSCPVPWYPTTSTSVILGVTFSDDCSFSAHIAGLVKKGSCALQSLITLRRLGFSQSQLKTVYVTYVRPILEYACPVWGPQAHNIEHLSEDLEAIQKRAVKVILGPKYNSYEAALSTLRLPTLRDRRLQLMCNFGQSLLSSQKHRSLLPPPAPITANTRHKNQLVPPKCRTTRHSNSFVPFFVSYLNRQ